MHRAGPLPRDARCAAPQGGRRGAVPARGGRRDRDAVPRRARSAPRTCGGCSTWCRIGGRSSARSVRVVAPGGVVVAHLGRLRGRSDGPHPGAILRAGRGRPASDRAGLGRPTTSSMRRWPGSARAVPGAAGGRGDLDLDRRGVHATRSRATPSRGRGRSTTGSVRAAAAETRAWAGGRVRAAGRHPARGLRHALAGLRPARESGDPDRYPVGAPRPGVRERAEGASSCRSPRSRQIWMDGELVPWKDANVHVLSHGLHYGSGVFEGIRAYATARGPAVWHLDAHLDRMFASAAIYHMDLPYSKDELTQATKDVITRERARRVLHPADRVPRVRRDGREPARRAGERGDRRVAVGRVPGRGRDRAGRPRQGLVVEAARPELAAERREGDRRLPGLDPGEGREREGRLRRGDPAERRGLHHRGVGREHLRGRPTASSSRRPRTWARSRASPGRP